MRKLLLFLFLAASAVAQTTTTYTGVIKDLTQQPVTSGLVTFTLTQSTDSTIPGNGRFIPTTVSCNINVDGTLSAISGGACAVTMNTALTPGGTSYRICIQPEFSTPGSCFFDYATTESKDITTIVPTLSTGPLNFGGIQGPPLDFIGVWSSTTVYRVGQAVSFNNQVYISLVNPNLNNTPSSSPSQWSIVVSPASLTAAPNTTQTVTQPSGTTFQTNSFNYVLNADQFPGSDIGAKINAAYAALPVTGGMITYPSAKGGGNFSTPIVFGVANKPVILSCQSAGAFGVDTLFYTGSGVAITFNNGAGIVPNSPSVNGIRDCNFQASPSATTLLLMGGTNGAEGGIVSNSRLWGGALTVNLGDNTWHVRFEHSNIVGGTQLLVTSGATNAGENIQFDHVLFANSGNFANGVVLGGGASGPGLNLQCNACSFDNAQLVVAGGIIEINGTHFEDPGNIVWPAPPYVQSGGLASINTATFFGDHPSGTVISAYIAVSGGMLTTDSIDTFGCNCTNIYTSSGAGHIVGRTPLNLSGPAGAVVNLIADTSSEPSTVDGGREYGFHSESAYSIQGNMDFLTGSFIHLRSNDGGATNTQAGTGTYLNNQNLLFVTTPDLAGYAHSKVQGVGTAGSGCGSYSSNLQFFTEKKNTANQTDTSTVAATLGCNKAFNVPAVISSGPTFSVSGCSATGALGGATAGQFNAGVAGTCTVTITIGNSIAAPNGWTCSRPTDISDPAKSGSWFETAFTTTTVTLSGTSGVGELIQFACTGY